MYSRVQWIHLLIIHVLEVDIFCTTNVLFVAFVISNYSCKVMCCRLACESYFSFIVSVNFFVALCLMFVIVFLDTIFA